ncbi:arylsulfatase [Pseudomaricurvus alcaniphilus]|uniref:arylsulfatase n=1 Tax=Pseudomaricurvus alcaniphilus TaxID=1166482 RepID=UPI001FB5AC3A|nr:arylsulfatase [Pseudomaricurvus alcaniphilus]
MATRRLDVMNSSNRPPGDCILPAYLRRLGLLLSVCLAPLACASNSAVAPAAATDKQPNILLILVDDMGFTDLGSFGGEIDTPNLDALAYAGVRFSNFQAAPTCSPTRAMLLTGTDNHVAGLGNMAEEMAPNQQGQPGYEGYLNQRVVTVASLLRDAGYRTYMTGKWHLGTSPETSPAARGFERSFAMLSGGASHYADMKPAYSPTADSKAPYRKDGELLQQLPANFDYSSQFYVDEMIDYLEQDKDSGKPFFAYLAYTAPHWPLQAPDSAIAKYAGRYNDGYDALAQRRLQRQKTLGLLDPKATATPKPAGTLPWSALDPAARKQQTRQMEIYAAMIDQVDHHTGRLVDYLKANALLDNTLILFMSDNGAEGHDLDSTWSAAMYPKIRQVIDTTHDFSYANMGKPNSYVFLGAGWAHASSPALRLYKGATSEGGTRVAAFAHFPRQLPAGHISHELVSVADITPTLLQLTGIEHPGTDYRGRAIAPPSGTSMLHAWRGQSVPADLQQRVLGMELMGKRAVRAGDWKLVHMPPPYGKGAWQLYNLREDIGEQRDLAASHPEQLKRMVSYWQKYASDNAVILPDWLSGY